MALRDELRKEVADIKSKQQLEGEQREADRAFFQQNLLPAMREAHAYFSEVVANLQIISPKVMPTYPLNPLSDAGVVLRQCDYKYRVDDGKSPSEIDILCQAVLDRPVDFYVETKERAEKHTALLDAYDFAHNRKNFLDKHFNIKGSTFFLEGPMHVHFRISASTPHRCLYIDFRNLGEQKSKRYKFSQEDFTEAFFDRLTNVLLRKENYLVTPKVKDVERDQLRRQLDVEKQKNAQDLAEGMALQKRRKQEEKDALLRNRTKRAVAEGSRTLFQRAKDSVSQAKELIRPNKDAPEKQDE
ncbi:MAG: hypothetical protein AB8C02_09135 [Halioglobus sp.]